MNKKEVQKEVQKVNLYLSIIDLIKDGKSPYGICQEYNISKSNAEYYINYIKKKGLIKNIGYATWSILGNYEEVKKEIKDFLVTDEPPTTNLHALQIKFPILSGKIRDKDWVIKEKLNNWIPKYKDFNILGGLKVKNNNNKSITVFAKSRDISNLEEVYNLAFKIRAFIFDYFKRENVILDIFNVETKNIHLETPDKKAERMNGKGDMFILDLNKKSEKIFEKDKINAKAWVDPSPKPFTVGTNDMEWKREYLSMPFNIRDMVSALGQLTPTIKSLDMNMKTHISVLRGIDKSFRKFNKAIDKLSQTRLNQFF